MAKQTKTAKTKESCEMYLYGIIGRGLDIDTNALIATIEAKRKDGVRSFTFYVNSDGGEVAQGAALFNYLDRTDVDITWVVDGIAASMMAVLITNPKHHVKAARHAKFMYHRVSGYVYGNSDETRAAADMMDSFEKTLIEMMALRVCKSAEETRNLYFDGVDHWLSAEEAVRAHLCDEIVVMNAASDGTARALTVKKDANTTIATISGTASTTKVKQFVWTGTTWIMID